MVKHVHLTILHLLVLLRNTRWLLGSFWGLGSEMFFLLFLRHQSCHVSKVVGIFYLVELIGSFFRRERLDRLRLLFADHARLGFAFELNLVVLRRDIRSLDQSFLYYFLI